MLRRDVVGSNGQCLRTSRTHLNPCVKHIKMSCHWFLSPQLMVIVVCVDYTLFLEFNAEQPTAHPAENSAVDNANKTIRYRS